MHVRRSNTILYCDLWTQTVEFYRAGLGLDATFESDWFVEFALGPASFVSVADASRASVAAGDGRGVTLSCQVDDVAAIRAALVAADVAVSEIGTRWGADVVDVFDPSGNRLEFWCDPPDGDRPSP